MGPCEFLFPFHLQASRKVQIFNIDELSMLVSGASDLRMANFLCLAQDATAAMVFEAMKAFQGFLWASFQEAGKELLGILFACRLVGCLQAGFHEFMRSAMRRVGAGMDVAAQQVRNKLPGHEASTYSKPRQLMQEKTLIRKHTMDGKVDRRTLFGK